jgi:hypothetical protein
LTFNRSLIHGFLDFKKKAFSTGTPAVKLKTGKEIKIESIKYDKV